MFLGGVPRILLHKYPSRMLNDVIIFFVTNILSIFYQNCKFCLAPNRVALNIFGS